MQSGQGMAQAATQGLSGLASQKSTDAELAKSVGGPKPDELSKAKAGGGAGGGGGGDTHPAGALGPAVTPSTSHTPPAVPAGASGGPPAPTPVGGSAMGAMPMGMPLGGLMPHGGQGGDGAGEKVPADKKVVVPPQPHTEPVTGRVSDRTAAAAEASRTRAESDDPDDEPPRGPIMRRITLAPLQDDQRKMTGFDELDDAAKVKYSQAELASTYDELTAILDRLAALRTDAVDPDGDVRFQLGPDGRLISLFIDESVPGRLTHLGLEEKLNDLLARANVVAQDSWKASR